MHKKRYIKNVLTLIFSLLFCLNLFAQVPNFSNEKRGIVLYPSDITSLGSLNWIELLSKNSINLIGIHTDTRLEPLTDLESFLKSKEGKVFLNACKEYDIDIEYELHALQDLLPRSTFHKHPEYFRLDEQGIRQLEYNMCFTSEPAYDVVEKNIRKITKWLKPSTHRYFFWTDDVQFAFCHCDGCKPYSVSEQALLYENKLLEMLRKIDPQAQVAHLAYTNTMESPKKVKPLEGVFLEYAPIQRNYNVGLTEKHLNDLKENLLVFPKETSHVLEYWLDVSMFSDWKKDKLVKLPWEKGNFLRDIKTYKNLGINSITTFGAWINDDYIEQYGVDHTNKVLSEYGHTLNTSENLIIDANLQDWDKNNYIYGLTNPWGSQSKDNTHFDYKITNDHFYFYFKTTDNTPTTSPYAKELSVEEGDRVELFFSSEKDLSKYYCVEINPEGYVLDYRAKFYRRFNDKWDLKSLRISTAVTENGYIVEGKISLDEFKSLRLVDEVYLGVFRADYQDGEKVNWYTKTIPDSRTPDFHIPSAFEKIFLN